MSTRTVLQLKCPVCRKNLVKPISWFNEHPCFCPDCGTTIDAKRLLAFEAIEGKLEGLLKKSEEVG